MVGCACTEHNRSIDESSSNQITRNLYSFARISMGSRCSIVIEAETEREAAQAARLGFDEIARIEQVLSDYRSDSEAMLLVVGNPGTWYPVSECLFEVLTLAWDIHNRTQGAFDPTIGAYTHLWRRSSMPRTLELSDARCRVGMDLVELDPMTRTVRFNASGMILDFGGIGKGYAAQRAVDLIQASGFPVVQVELGGDLVLGSPPSTQKTGWSVEIQTGLGDATVEHLFNCAVATSGDLERFYEYNGARYSHIVDPRTGYGISERRAVAVIAADGAIADALASAVSVLGLSGVKTIVEEYPEADIRLVTRGMDEE